MRYLIIADKLKPMNIDVFFFRNNAELRIQYQYASSF